MTDINSNGQGAKGVIVKTYNSYYYLESANKRITCTLRGRFKKEKFSLLVGDEVIYTQTSPNEGVIEKILPRKSMLRRPKIANVNHAVLIFAAVNPDISLTLLDRFLVLSEQSELEISICINKVDLVGLDLIEKLAAKYRNIGYQVLLISAKNSLGILELRERLRDKVSVFSGPSGVGKSTILNALEPGLNLATGQISQKIGRGKHTTRFAELLKLSGGGFVVDTPGFSLTEFDEVQETDLMYYFPEFSPFISGCKFNTCLHLKEPQCRIKEALEEGLILPSRYESYVDILTKIRESGN